MKKRKKYKVITLYDNEEEIDNCLNELKRRGYIYEVTDVSSQQLKAISESENMADERKLKRHIIDKLDSIGMPSNRRGYEYIISGVILLFKKGKIHHMEMKRAYIEISNIYRRSSHSVEKAIREVIARTCTHGHLDELHKLFFKVISKKTGTISNRKFIYELAKQVV